MRRICVLPIGFVTQLNKKKTLLLSIIGGLKGDIPENLAVEKLPAKRHRHMSPLLQIQMLHISVLLILRKNV